jgi:hypothetical protein
MSLLIKRQMPYKYYTKAIPIGKEAQTSVAFYYAPAHITNLALDSQPKKARNPSDMLGSAP